MPRIAVDAMGGDRGPAEVVAGAVAAARDGLTPILYGNAGLDAQGLEHRTTHGVVAMDDKPADVVRTKPESSLVASIRAVAAGEPTRSSPRGTRARRSPPACSSCVASPASCAPPSRCPFPRATARRC